MHACPCVLHCLTLFQDGHEICFVGDEAFRQLSQVDPKADQLINEVSTYSIYGVFITIVILLLHNL